MTATVIYLPGAERPPVKQPPSCGLCRFGAMVDGEVVCAVANDVVTDVHAEAASCEEYEPWRVGQ